MRLKSEIAKKLIQNDFLPPEARDVIKNKIHMAEELRKGKKLFFN